MGPNLTLASQYFLEMRPRNVGSQVYTVSGWVFLKRKERATMRRQRKYAARHLKPVDPTNL
jgi:hypothetical protein